MALLNINWNPDGRELRMFSALWLPLFAVSLGALVYFRLDLPALSYAIWGAGLGLAMVGLLVPAVARLVYLALVCATFPIGYVVSHVTMFVIFFGILAPIAVVGRLFGYDPMARRFEREATSYWRDRPRDKETASYFRQS